MFPDDETSPIPAFIMMAIITTLAAAILLKALL